MGCRLVPGAECETNDPLPPFTLYVIEHREQLIGVPCAQYPDDTSVLDDGLRSGSKMLEVSVADPVDPSR